MVGRTWFGGSEILAAESNELGGGYCEERLVSGYDHFFEGAYIHSILKVVCNSALSILNNIPVKTCLHAMSQTPQNIGSYKSP